MYKAKIYNPEHDVHDGDTLLNVEVKIFDIVVSAEKCESVERWPNIELKEDGIYAKESIRIYGIDTAEVHPHHKDAHGNPRTARSLENERQLAVKARIELYRLLEKHNFEFWVKDWINGKYAGRVVAKVLVGDDDQNLIDVSEYLLDKGLAHPYFGHTKEPWS